MNILWDIVFIQLLSGQALAEPFQLPFAKHSGSAGRFKRRTALRRVAKRKTKGADPN
jgi:hypothetical protein